MAYIIALPDQMAVERFMERFTVKVKKNKKFRIGRILGPETEVLLGRAARRRGVPRLLLTLQSILLIKSKPYCGQHPGECPIDAPRPKSTHLEWDDWIAFNKIVNDILDTMKVEAEVWSNPRELSYRGQGKRFWIRKDGHRRVKYDWRDDWDQKRKRMVRRWDMRSNSQFIQEAST